MNNTVISKDGNRVFTVFDVTYDRNGYPHFLVFDGKSWVKRSAKYFRPAVIK